MYLWIKNGGSVHFILSAAAVAEVNDDTDKIKAVWEEHLNFMDVRKVFLFENEALFEP